MRKIVYLGWIAVILLAVSCSTVRLESSYKDPDVVLFNSQKLLVVGLTQDMRVREAFESRLQEIFEDEGIETMRSIDLFDVEFTSAERSEEELSQVEAQLIEKDFDAILFTKVLGTETHTTLRRKIRELGESYEQFNEDYILHQGVYYDRDYYEIDTDYYVESSVYCVCPGKARNLIWRSVVLISEPNNTQRAIRDFIDLITEELAGQQVLLEAHAY
ncbi:hypothetical protein OZ410_09005 [Robiginitalea sp. M366]|uniref:hypothetical protein n=1 Tax=Robiginitalea aestuariiviva TaxID=3036903 RepID=UPI00240DAAC2|nr:hypothetical protein [Robiginitalea aestuariiviva]MDG1572452.1 hypothetical protein [Robiginitalea aestuariiviva]